MRPRDDSRAEVLAARPPDAGADAMLVTDLLNVRYLTGFTGSNGAEAFRSVLAGGLVGRTERSVAVALELEMRERGSAEPLAEARDLFTGMGYRPAIAETERLLGEALAGTA